MRWLLPAAAAWVLVAGGCSLTNLPDTSSSWQQPCDPPLRRCGHTFTLAKTNQTSVELRGDFDAGAWQAGVPMALDGGTWEAELTVSWGADVQYKFFVDGTMWILDPANPQTVPDGKGNTNSILRGITCERWTCE